jgi:hypothetical protein
VNQTKAMQLGKMPSKGSAMRANRLVVACLGLISRGAGRRHGHPVPHCPLSKTTPGA